MARTHQEHSEALWNKLSQKFASKDDVLNSTLVKQGWKLVESVVGNNTITLPSIDTVTEIYIEMYDTDGTIVHHTDLRKESLQFESTNISTREIVLDNMHDTQTYVTYSLENNTIVPSCYEGIVLDGESTNVTTVVYIKELLEMSVTDLQANNIQYDNSVSGINSNNVQGAIDKVVNTLGYTASKNLIRYPFHETTKTENGIKWVDIGDGTISANGTSTVGAGDSARFNVQIRTLNPISLKKGTYILSGCPEGGSASTYLIAVVKTDNNGDGYWITDDYGNSATFTLDEDCDTIGVQIRILTKEPVNLIFKPMIRYANIEDNTFESYSESMSTQIGNINNKLKNTIISKYINANLGSPGWYRIAKMECSNISEANGATSNSCEIEIKRTYANLSTEYKKIKLLSIYQASSFADEISKNYNNDTNTITKIRQTVDTATKTTYIEVYYKSTTINGVTFIINNQINGLTREWELIEPISTSETINGVNVLCSHEFLLNTNRPYGIEEIKHTQTITSATTETVYYTYKATRKCIINISYNAIYNASAVKSSAITLNSTIVTSMATTTPNSSQQLSVSLLLNKDDYIQCLSAYQSAAQNAIKVFGYVQYLE